MNARRHTWCGLITVYTVVQNCCKGDQPCQWKTPIFRPSGIENPWSDRHQIWQGWLRRGHHPTSNFGISIPRGDSCIYAWNSHHQCKKTYQCKGVICHSFKTAKIIVFEHMKCKKSKCALTRRDVVLISFVVHVIQYAMCQTWIANTEVWPFFNWLVHVSCSSCKGTRCCFETPPPPAMSFKALRHIWRPWFLLFF